MQNNNSVHQYELPFLILAVTARSQHNRLTDTAIIEIYETDPIAKIFDKIAFWLSSAEWGLLGDEPDLVSQVYEYLESLNIFEWLGSAYKFACLFGTANLVLNADWQTGLEIVGVKHAGDYLSFKVLHPKSEIKEDSFVYSSNQFGDAWYDDNTRWRLAHNSQLTPELELGSFDRIRRIYPAYNAYLSSLEVAYKLASTGNVVIIGSEDLADDRSDYNDEEFETYLQGLAQGVQRQLNNNGVCVFPGDPKVVQVNRSSNDLEKLIGHFKTNFQFASDLSEYQLFGEISSGSSLSDSQARDNLKKASFIKVRRNKFFKPIVNFIIARFLRSIGENPNSVRINFDIIEPLSAAEQSEISLNRAKREKIQLESGILSVEEVRATYFDKHTPDDVVISEESNESSTEKTDSKSNYRRQLWSEYNTVTNLSFDELVELRDLEIASKTKQDAARLDRNIILKTVTEEEFLSSTELQRWARQSIQRLKKLDQQPDSPYKKRSQFCNGFDDDLVKRLPKSIVYPKAPTQHTDTAEVDQAQAGEEQDWAAVKLTPEEILQIRKLRAQKILEARQTAQNWEAGVSLSPEEVIPEMATDADLQGTPASPAPQDLTTQEPQPETTPAEDLDLQ